MTIIFSNQPSMQSLPLSCAATAKTQFQMSVDALNEIWFSRETCFFVNKRIYFCEYNFLQKLSPVIITSTDFEEKFPSLCKFYSWSGRNIYFGRCVVSFYSTFFSIDYSWAWRALWLIFQKKKKNLFRNRKNCQYYYEATVNTHFRAFSIYKNRYLI